MAERIYLSSPTMHGEEHMYIKEAFDTNWVAPLGMNVDEFEKEIAAYVGVRHAAALTAGTAALHLAGVKRGDKVFCSDLTFSATVNPSAELGYGTVVCARVVIGSGAKVGRGCIISSGAAIGRKVEVPEGTHVDCGQAVRNKTVSGV